MSSFLASWRGKFQTMRFGGSTTELGWTGQRRMLRRAGAARFEIFVTGDQNLQFQQNLFESPLGVIVLAARSNTLEDLVPLIPALPEAIARVQPGEVERVAG